MKTPQNPIIVLENELKQNEKLKSHILSSLSQANEIAKKDLDVELYNALCWPTSIEHYLAYLRSFAKWKPQQSSSSAWNKTDYDQNQEVYDRLCHFYWLIDQKIDDNGSKLKVEVQNGEWFSKWLVDYANYWGYFLNTPESFNDEILESFIKNSPQYNVLDSMIVEGDQKRPNAPSGWLTFNQFFARELNPGLRPISIPNSNLTVTSPADCTFKASYPITNDSTIEEITLKKTHKYASIEDLLEGSEFKDDFSNGTFVHYFLGPYDYHRFHTPVAGRVMECYPVKGLTYLNVNISKKQFDAPDGSEDGYEFSQARGIIVIDTAYSENGNIGKVAIIPVGMCQVSSVNMTAQVESDLLKGDEFGYFLFGGSDIIMLFQNGIDLQLDTLPVHHNYGTIVATAKAVD
ncbi:MAG: phosphatidylserine decarboxylase [Flavobacteriaceae bacterium]|nr:phosphatidylserine decarboxylase [Flavobacteriaceae bacterium]